MRRLRTLLVLRLLLVANVVIIATVGGLWLAFVDGSAGPVGAALCWLAAGGLLGLLPLTDPYRVPRSQRH
jgi:hypothetical protein